MFKKRHSRRRKEKYCIGGVTSSAEPILRAMGPLVAQNCRTICGTVVRNRRCQQFCITHAEALICQRGLPRLCKRGLPSPPRSPLLSEASSSQRSHTYCASAAQEQIETAGMCACHGKIGLRLSSQLSKLPPTLSGLQKTGLSYCCAHIYRGYTSRGYKNMHSTINEEICLRD